MSRRKAIAAAGITVLAAYFIVLPIFWSSMAPDAAVTMPATWRHDTDLPIHVRVTSAHPNFVPQEVRATFDYAPADGQGTPYPRILYQVQKTDRWAIFQVNRCTFPCSKDLDVVLPLAELARSDGIRPGLLRGQLQVSIDYVRALNRTTVVMGVVRASSRTVAIPYELTLE